MLRHLTFIALLILLLSTEVPGSCVAKPSIEKAVEGSALVFVGKVTKIIPAQLATASYSVQRRKRLWEKYFFKTDIVTFEVSEVLKGVPGETIEIATSADGEAGYKFEGGTWLKVGQSYLVYASKRKLEGTVDSDWTGYEKSVARKLKEIQESLPKSLAEEINEMNSKFTPYSASICGRTQPVADGKEELDQLHRIFPNAMRADRTKTEPLRWKLSFWLFGLLSLVNLTSEDDEAGDHLNDRTRGFRVGGKGYGV